MVPGMSHSLQLLASALPVRTAPCAAPARRVPLLPALVLALTAGCVQTAEGDPFRIVGPAHFVDGFAPVADDGRVQVLVEIPTGTLAKWEVSKKDGALEWQFEEEVPRVVQYLGYPGNYGMVPGTYLPKDLGGDGDPLDVLVLGTALDRGAIVSARLIGVMEMLDGGEQDNKLIAVLDGTPFERIGSIDELDERYPGVTTIVSTWFRNYKRGAKVEVSGFLGPDEAETVLAAAIEAYRAAQVAQNSTHAGAGSGR